MKTWPSKAEIEEAMNEMPTEMVHDAADKAFDLLTHRQLTCLLASHALRQPRIIKLTASDAMDVVAAMG